MPPSMDKPHNHLAAPASYETRDANVRWVFNFLVILGLSLVLSALVCWGLFRYFSRRQAQAASASPFAETRQISLGPQLQVNPREDWLKYREQQEQSLETYAWENRAAGTVRVPIEEAMELLVQKGLPVQTDTPPAQAERPAAKAGKKP